MGGTPLYKLYRYVPPHRVGLFAPFWSENGYTLCPFWSGIGYVFRGNYGDYERNYRLISKNKSEIETCEFDTHLKNSFVCALI